jgi:putative membrane protein
MQFLYVKALHIIFVVTWFAGLFYIVRLFVYAAEAEALQGPEKDILGKQYLLMKRRLWYGITWPSMVLTLVFGTWMLVLNPSYLYFPWFQLKLAMVALLLLYHASCGWIHREQGKGRFIPGSTGLRIWNEVATVFLVGIVFVVVLKSMLSAMYALLGLILFSALMLLAIRIYKKVREQSGE